jgi:hypothetical protein
MTNRIQQIFVVLWMSTLLVASVGLSAHKVYCYCVGESTISFFVAEDACQMEGDMAQTADCCAPKTAAPQPSCCSKPEKKEDGCGDCTQKTTVVLKLKTDAEPCVSCFKKMDAPKSWAACSAIVPTLPQLSAVYPIEVAPLSERPPPPVSGRALCIRFGVFRC